MSNPYSGLPPTSFWRRAISALPADEVDPVTQVPFTIARTDKVATAGSCFAQHLSRVLTAKGFAYHVVEPGPLEESFGVFSARYGNIYTVRQLLQLFQRAYGLFEPADGTWRLGETVVDPFRPRVSPQGFVSAEAMLADRERHLAAVRTLIETSDVFLFTLGQTEGWRARLDGALVPLAPGVHGAPPDDAAYDFVNADVAEMIADLTGFIDRARTVNPGLRFILTVSPVAMIATYEPQHVLASSTYSKAALRVVAETVSRARADVAYFPSYEIVTGAHTRGRYLADDLREVTAEGVERVMTLFARHYLAETGRRAASPERAAAVASETGAQRQARAALHDIVCDEDALDA